MKLASLMMVLAACGGSDAMPDATVPDAEIAAPCNTIEDLADDVVEVGVAEVAPTPGGGTIEDGTYVVTAAVYYTGVGGMTGETGVTYHATSVNTGGTYEYVDSGGDAELRTNGAYQTSGIDDIDVVQQCPTLGPVNFDKYTATPDELILFNTDMPTAIQVLTFTRQ